MPKGKQDRAVAYIDLNTLDAENADFKAYLRENKIVATKRNRKVDGRRLYRFTGSRRALVRFVNAVFVAPELAEFIKESK